jgi:feruloyl esterase
MQNEQRRMQNAKCTMRRVSAILMTVFCFDLRSASAATACDNLAMLSLPNTTVTLAQSVPAGAFTPPVPAGRAGAAGAGAGPGGGAAGPAGGGGRGRGQQFTDLPAFCRVQATLKPSSDSDIKMELWMPVAASWNGKLRGTGNGGLGGGAGVNAGALAGGVRLGYATAGNNTGHEGDSRYALDHPEQIKDFGYRSAHEMTVAAKAFIKAYYDKPQTYSVIAEGGGGTIAALSSAQRYPEDYDVVAVTGMSSYLTRHTFGQMWYWQATHKDPESYIPPEKYAVLHQAALDACDALDGLEDGIIGDVEHCKFDPGVLQCKGAEAPTCLTAEQVEAARKIYAGPTNSRTKQEIYSPMYPGSELGWAQLAGGDAPLGIPVEFFKYYVFRDPNWDYKTRPIDFDKDVALADRPEIQPVNAVDPDLKRFFARGGKLLLVDGWADTSVPPKVSINYYKNVLAKTGAGAVKESMRFFIVPAMGHGPGTNGVENFNFDALGVVEQWKQTGKAPDQLIVSHYKNGIEVGKRLVCQYPQVARYKGSGNTEDPASYGCR